ncbi:unnamed protein product [Caretta caretta]
MSLPIALAVSLWTFLIFPRLIMSAQKLPLGFWIHVTVSILITHIWVTNPLRSWIGVTKCTYRITSLKIMEAVSFCVLIYV